MFGKLCTQTTTRGRFSYTALSTDENPLQRILLENILQRGIGEILVVVVVGEIGHGCCCSARRVEMKGETGGNGN